MKFINPLTKKISLSVLTVLIGAIGLIFFYRQFIFSGGEWIIGDMADGRLILSIHEHWFRFFTGVEGWKEMGFFYPIKDVLGYSDTFFLTGLAHSAFRGIGLDKFLSFQLSQMLLGFIGYMGMFYWLLKYRKTGYSYALFGAFLLLVASPIYLSTRNSHIQLQAVWLVPWIAILMETAWRDCQQNPRRLLFSFTTLCAFYGALAYSTFYMAWFTLLFMIIWTAGAALLFGWRSIWTHLREILQSWRFMIPGILAGISALLLFLNTYLPVRMEQGGRSLKLAIRSLPQPWDFFNHSETNLLWGKINGYLYPYAERWWWEKELGPTLLFTIIVIATALIIVRTRKILTDQHSKFNQTLSLAVLISFILLVRIWYLSFWVVPYFIIPGADGIRACFRFMVFLVVPTTYLLIIGMKRIRDVSPGWIGAALVTLLGALIILEQGQTTSNCRLNREEQLEILANLPPPPADATAFVLHGAGSHEYYWDIMQNSAITYSQHWNLPTIGGRSGFLPIGWDLREGQLPELYRKLIKWCNHTNDVTGTIYLFNSDTLEWGEAFQFPLTESEGVGEFSASITPDQLYYLTVSGWSDLEPWGIWSTGTKAVLKIPYFEEATYPLQLDVVYGAYLSPNHPSQRITIRLDGEIVHETVVSTGDREARVSIQLADTSRSLIIETPDAVSPLSLKEGSDSRVLGMALKEVTIRKGGSAQGKSAPGNGS